MPLQYRTPPSHEVCLAYICFRPPSPIIEQSRAGALFAIVHRNFTTAFVRVLRDCYPVALMAEGVLLLPPRRHPS